MPEPSVSDSTPAGRQVVPAGTETLVLDPAPVAVPGADAPDVVASRRLGVLGWIAIVWLAAVAFGAVFAPVLPISDPNQPFFDKVGQGPQAGHLFGLDGNGTDMFARVVWGARASLLVAVASVLVGMVGGGILGLLSGFYRGKVDTILTNVFNVFLAIPQLVLALALVAVFASGDNVSTGRREFWLIVSIGLVSIPILGRITRASALAWSQREFVLAARAMGARNGRIMIREVLPNVLPAMFSIALLGIAVVIVIEGGLSILGVGVPPSTPSWGNLIAIGRNELSKITGSYPQVILAPSAAIFLTVLSLNYLGDVVRARFDVRESAL